MPKFILIIVCFFSITSFCIGQSSVSTYLQNQTVLNVFTDDKMNLFIAAEDTTYLYDGLNFLQSSFIEPTDDSLMTSIESLLSTNDEYGLLGSLTTWAGLDSDRIIFTNKTSRLYQSYNGKIQRYLIPDLEEQNLIINKLVSAGDYLLICTLNDGLYIWKHKEFILDKLNYSQGLETNNINDALLDDWGNLWIATDFGLKKLTYINKKDKSYPHVSIDKVNVLYDQIATDDIIELDESQNSLQFHFSARDYSANDDIKYQYRTSEADSWTDTKDEVLSLSALKPANYSFEIRATNGNGLYGYAEPINFNIKSSSLNNVWKYALGGVGLLGLLWMWSLSRYNKSVKSFERERTKLRLENDLLKTEQKALQLQMNPHFIFNALNSIQGLIATNENKAARKYLNKFSSMMRSMLVQSRGDAISLEDEIKYLDNYMSIERMGREDRFDFEINRSKLVPDIKIPSMLLQPFVENAIVHGMKGLTREGKILVKFKMKDGNLVCEIDDNGVGRIENSSKPGHDSIGLKVVTDRLSKYSKFKNYKNLQIIDKKNEDGTNAGTKVLINLPQL